MTERLFQDVRGRIGPRWTERRAARIRASVDRRVQSVQQHDFQFRVRVCRSRRFGLSAPEAHSAAAHVAARSESHILKIREANRCCSDSTGTIR